MRMRKRLSRRRVVRKRSIRRRIKRRAMFNVNGIQLG